MASTSQELRENKDFTALGHFNALSSWIPYKKALSFGYNFNNRWTLEASYETGSISIPSAAHIDLGRIKEDRYSINARKFTGNSFHFIFGGSYHKLNARVGNDFLDNMTDQSIKSFNVSSIDITLGVGNRWQWDNGFSLQMEWFKFNYPILGKKANADVVDNITDEDDKKDLEDALDTLKSFPTFTLLGIGLGYSF